MSKKREKVFATFYTYSDDLIRILRQMHTDGLSYECPENHYHLVYPLEEYGHKLKKLM